MRGKVLRTSLLLLAIILILFTYIEIVEAIHVPGCPRVMYTKINKKSEETRVGCTIYNYHYEQEFKTCTNPDCGHVEIGPWVYVGRTYLRTSHLYDEIEYAYKNETEQVGCSVYTVRYRRSRQVCARCGATSSWTSWTEISRTFSHYSHSYTTETETRTRTVQSGCTIYSVNEKRTRQKCTRCGATTTWSSWTETSRTISGYSHLYDTPESEERTVTDQVGCEVFTVKESRTRLVCSRCGAVSDWTSWKEISRTFSHYSHAYTNTTETKTEIERVGCSNYKVTYQRTKKVCSRCGDIVYTSWVETSRVYDSPAHNLDIIDTETDSTQEWRGRDLWETTLARLTYQCLRCGEIIYSDWVVISERIIQTDNTAPTVTASKQSSEWGPPVIVTLTYTDSETGVKTKQYTWSTGTSTPTSWSSYTSSVSQSDGGTWYLHYRTEDNGGNIRTGYFGPYKIDAVAPTGSVTPSSSSDWVFEVTVNAADEHSGVKRIYYQWSKETVLPTGTEWTNWSYVNGSTAKLAPPVSDIGWYVVTVIEDNAGNSTIKVGGSYKFDLIAPQIISFSPSSAPANCYSIEVEITSQSLGPSGIKETYWVWTRQGDPVPPLSEWTCITQWPDIVKTGQNQAGDWILRAAVYSNAGKVATATAGVYRIGTDEVTVHISPTSHPAWTRSGIGVQVELEKSNSGGGDDDYWPSIQVVSCWQETFQDGRKSLKRYSFQSGWYLYNLGVPSNGEWSLDIFALSQAGNTYYPDEGICGPYRRDTIPPEINAPVRRYVAYNQVELQVETWQWSPSRTESYRVLAREQMLDETWQYVWWLQLRDDYYNTFWIKANDLPGYGVGDVYYLPGHSKCSAPGGTESVWSTSATPPASGWVSRPDYYTTYKTIGAGEAWYHHVRAWDAAGNTSVATFGPFARSGSPDDPPDQPPAAPTAKITGPSELTVGQEATYTFTGTAHHDPEMFSPGFKVVEAITSNTIVQGGFTGTLNYSRDLTFTEPGWYLLNLTVMDSLGRTANASLFITVTSGDPGDPGDPGGTHLTAALTPYTVKHGEQLTVYASSSEPDPWVQVWGQIHPMTHNGEYWQTQITVADEWPLGTNYLAVHNGIDTVILDFQIAKPFTGTPRTRIVD